MIRAMAFKIAAMIKGKCAEYCPINPPIAGPAMSPAPKAAPNFPNHLVLSAFFVCGKMFSSKGFHKRDFVPCVSKEHS